jgi:hypothetical protein
VLGGFLLYLIDGFVALQLATRAWNLRLHGTLYVTAHTGNRLPPFSSGLPERRENNGPGGDQAARPRSLNPRVSHEEPANR